MYHVSDKVRSTHSRDGGVVLDIQRGQMFKLNLVGSRILELLKGGLPESDIVDGISREFDVSRNLVQADVREFVQSLKSNKLIEE